MKETMEMIQILDKNKKEAQKRIRQEKIRNQKKEQLTTKVLVALVIILFIITLGVLKNIMDRDYNNCIHSGKSADVCETYRSIDK